MQVPGRPYVSGSSGPAMEGVEWKLGSDGEVFIRSPGVFRGYLHEEKGTHDVLDADGWLASGDIVEVRGGDEVAVVDRKKAIIITSGGKNIAPSEIESWARCLGAQESPAHRVRVLDCVTHALNCIRQPDPTRITPADIDQDVSPELVREVTSFLDEAGR